jgi:hypothetical protein
MGISIEVSILRFTIRILWFDTIQMDKNTNLYFVSLERRILRIVSVSFCISIRYVSQRYNNFKIHILFLLLPLLLDFTHPVRRSDNPSVREKRRKKTKSDKKKKKYASDLREELKTPSTKHYKWVILICFIYFFLPCRDGCSKT